MAKHRESEGSAGKSRRSRRTPDEQIADLEAEIARIRAEMQNRDRFSSKDVARERERLELSAADYAELVGVSPLTIYGWEQGKSRPRPAQLEQWLSVRGISKREAYQKLGKESGATGFSPEAIATERARLELSAADYARLIGVSPLTIYAWEQGRSRPRSAKLEAWLAVRGIAKREAYDQLGIAPASGAFSSQAVADERNRLELSAADYGRLVGVSALTIYGWEQGKSSPRQAKLEAWLSVRGIDKREAYERLGLEPSGGAFSPDAVAAERRRLELSAADYGSLLGVSQLTIYNWEKGRSRPRAKQLAAWLAVRGIGKRKAWKTLGY